MAKPADLAGAYLTGVKTAAEIREAQNRLSQQQAESAARAQEMQQRLAAQAKQQEQENQVEQQRIAVTSAYHQQQVQLEKQKLAEAEKMNLEKTATAMRQHEAQQAWQTGFSAIEKDANLNAEQKDAAKTSLIMRLAPTMGIPGTEAASMIREMRPAKPTVPASVTDQGDFVKVTQPNGTVVLHRKPAAAGAAAKDTMVRVALDKDNPAVTTTMPKSQAVEMIGLDPELRSNPVNVAILRGAVKAMQKDLPASAPASGAPPATGGGQRVRVRRPDGTVGTVDSAKLEAALKAGFKRLD